MKKIEGTIYWDGENLQIADLPRLAEQMKENFKPGYYDATFQPPWQWRTSEAMGYFWGEIAVRAKEGLLESGYEVSTKEAAVDFIMEQLPSGRWVEEVKRFGKPVKTSVRSIGSLSRQELHDLTDEMIKFIADWFNIACGTPEDYKKLWKLKSKK